MSTTTPTTLGIFASIKYVIVTLCSMLVKAIGEADGTLDIISDVRLTAKTYSDQLYQEAILTSKQQLKALAKD